MTIYKQASDLLIYGERQKNEEATTDLVVTNIANNQFFEKNGEYFQFIANKNRAIVQHDCFVINNEPYFRKKSIGGLLSKPIFYIYESHDKNKIAVSSKFINNKNNNFSFKDIMDAINKMIANNIPVISYNYQEHSLENISFTFKCEEDITSNSMFRDWFISIINLLSVLSSKNTSHLDNKLLICNKLYMSIVYDNDSLFYHEGFPASLKDYLVKSNIALSPDMLYGEDSLNNFYGSLFLNKKLTYLLQSNIVMGHPSHDKIFGINDNINDELIVNKDNKTEFTIKYFS